MPEIVDPGMSSMERWRPNRVDAIARFFGALQHSVLNCADVNELNDPAVDRLGDLIDVCLATPKRSRAAALIHGRQSPEVNGSQGRSLNLHERVAMDACLALVTHDTTRLEVEERTDVIVRTLAFLVDFDFAYEDETIPEIEEARKAELGSAMGDALVRVVDAAQAAPTEERLQNAGQAIAACIEAGLLSQDIAERYLRLPGYTFQGN